MPPVAHEFDNASVRVGDRRGGGEQFGLKLPKRGLRAGLVRAHQAGLADHVSGQDGSETALHNFCPSAR